MVVKKRPHYGGDTDSESESESDSDCFEIRQTGQTPPSSSVTRKHHHDHDHDVSGTEARLRRRKQLTTLVSSTVSKMVWSKHDELVILGSIVDYEKETKLSYRSNWDAFYDYIKVLIDTNFSKTQLIDKIRHLKKRFDNNIARSKHGKAPAFTNTHDDEIFKLSMIIWPSNVTMCASNYNIQQAKDVPCVEHERVNENMDQKKGEPVSNISMENNKGEKEKSEEDGADEFYALQDALEATTLFQSSSKYQQKKLLQNLENLGAQRRKELADEWKALLAEDLQLFARKLTFTAKLANAASSS